MIRAVEAVQGVQVQEAQAAQEVQAVQEAQVLPKATKLQPQINPQAVIGYRIQRVGGIRTLTVHIPKMHGFR